MKTKLILSGLLLSAFGLSASAQDKGAIVTKTFPVVADTWIYEGNSEIWGKATTIEVQYAKSEKKEGDQVIETNYARKVGLLSFDIEVPYGMSVDNACLYLVTERRKVNPAKIHLYENNFVEMSANWESESQYITSALNSPAIEFTPAGESGKATFDNINDDNKNLTAWANIIDITSLISDLSGSQKVNLMIENGSETSTADNRFYTKENEGIVKDKTIVEWASNISTQDLSPVLVITFVNKDAIVRAYADTWVGPGIGYKGSEGTIELKYNGESGSNHGLMAFKIPATPEGLKLNSASLVLTTERVQSIHEVYIYDYDSDFDENQVWENVKDKISEVTQGDYFMQFWPKGQGGKAIFDGLNVDNQTLDAWKNEIDVTDFVKGKIIDANDETRINLLFKKKEESTNQICFYTKDTGNVRANKANTDWIQKAHITPGQIRPYLLLKYEPSEIAWTNNDVKIEGNNVNLSHKLNNKIKVSGGNNIDHRQLDLVVEKINTASLSAYAMSDEETHIITKNSDHIEVEFKKAGNYILTLSGADGSSYVMPENAVLSVTVDPIKVAVGTPEKIEWSSESTYTLEGLVEIEGEYSGDYKELFNLDVTPAWDNYEGIKDAETYFEPDWLYNQMVAILKAGNDVDGYLIANPTVDLQENSDLVVTASCSGTYKVTFTSNEEGAVFVNNDNSDSQEVIVNIAPSFTQKFSYDLNGKTYENDGLNISGAQVTVGEEGGSAVLSDTEFENAIIYVPGVYFVTLGYEVSKSVGPRDMAENQTIQNGGSLDLKDASSVTLTMTKNGVTTDPLNITLTKGTPTAIETLEAADGEALYFNLQGVEVKNPERGVFIKMQYGKASKVIL